MGFPGSSVDKESACNVGDSGLIPGLGSSLYIHVHRDAELSYSRPKERAFQVALLVKNPPANAEDLRDSGSILGSAISPGAGHSNPLQYSCLENPMDRRAWQATVHRVTKSQTQLRPQHIPRTGERVRSLQSPGFHLAG